jgi:HEAT repeat protein
MKKDPVLAALAGLDEIPLRTAAGQKLLAKALAAKSNQVVAKAARIAGDSHWVELTGELAKTFGRFFQPGAVLDKGCVALIAIARALFNLDYDEPELYLSGMHHVQMEPVWGGSVDTAAELRAVCAMGLAGARCPDKLRELVRLLVDKEWQARAGAARAIATVGSEAASLLLRFKALSGDQEPEVLSDCFAGLLAIEGAEGVRLVAELAGSKNEVVREAAFLSLGASRRPDAVEWMKARFGEVADVQTRQCILLALATSRTEAAIEFLLQVIREASSQTSGFAVSAMEVNGGDERLRGEVEKALRARSANAGGGGSGAFQAESVIEGE